MSYAALTGIWPELDGSSTGTEVLQIAKGLERVL